MRRFIPLAEHPFELLFGLLAFAGGTVLTLGFVTPASLNASLPGLVVRVWGAMQLMAGALIVAGIILRYWRPAFVLVGLRLERAGLWPLAAACTVYGVVALGYAGLRAVYPAAVLLAFAAGCVARARSVARIESTIRRHQGGPVGE